MKYFYFFSPTLETHVHLYYSWVMAARSQKMPITLLTLLKKNVFYEQRDLVRYWRKQQATQIRVVRKAHYEYVMSFFKWQSLLHRRIVVHLRKQPYDPFISLRSHTGGRLRFIVELEGDPKLELDFLQAHPYLPDFYDQIVLNMKKQIEVQERVLNEADHILVVSTYLRDILCERYPSLNLTEKISIIPTGATLIGNGPDKIVRDRVRAEMGWSDNFLITYIGNVFYSWQSLSSCLNAFRLIRENLQTRAKLLLLIRKQDWPIARNFIERAQLSEEDYFLSSVAPQEVGSYMSACDLGLLLRPMHPAMLAGSPGKFGDYVLNGLPVLMSSGVGDYADMAKRDNVFPVVNDIESREEILTCAEQLISMTWEYRERIAEWARAKISSMANARRYVQTLEKVSLLTCESF